MNKLEAKSLELKAIVGSYQTEWLLGDLASKIDSVSNGNYEDELEDLSSPMRQLYYLAGLLLSTNSSEGVKNTFSSKDWEKIVELLNSIEQEYFKLFFPKSGELISDEWRHNTEVVMSSFFTYFNRGPLDYEEQVIRWTEDLFTPFDKTIKASSSLVTLDFIHFYETLDSIVNKSRAGLLGGQITNSNWREKTKLPDPNFPVWLPNLLSQEAMAAMFYSMDNGMVRRFTAAELNSPELSIEKIKKILSLLSCKREATDYKYYSETRPGNPLVKRPIVELEDGIFQAFEIKQVMHAIQDLLEDFCSSDGVMTKGFNKWKGKLLEKRVLEIFTDFLGKDEVEVFCQYFVDGNEQDILILWKKYAFIIEPKAYSLREPLRDPAKAFLRIKEDFNGSIGKGYIQTHRIEKKFIEKQILKITDKNGRITKEINTNDFEYDFSIVVTHKSFGPIQNDLSSMLERENDDDLYPWAIKLDDLEVFLLTMKAKGKKPIDLVNFLLFREDLHGHLICSDELEICGGFLEGKFRGLKISENSRVITEPTFAEIFDRQYEVGIGFKNEKFISGKAARKKKKGLYKKK